MPRKVTTSVSPAAEIGNNYRLAKKSIIDGTLRLIECGKMLEAQKTSMNHGEWEPWLEANKEELGFGAWTARRLMSASKRWLTTVLTEPEALEINREIWGNEPEPEPEPKSPPQSYIVEYSDPIHPSAQAYTVEYSDPIHPPVLDVEHQSAPDFEYQIDRITGPLVSFIQHDTFVEMLNDLEIIKEDILDEIDMVHLNRVIHALTSLSKRAQMWADRLTPVNDQWRQKYD
jgi:hypothetical protein